MGDDFVSKDKQQQQELDSKKAEIAKNKTRTSELETRNGELDKKINGFNSDKANDKQKSEHNTYVQEHKSNRLEIQTNKQQLPQLEHEREQLKIRNAASKVQGNDATKQAQVKSQVLEAGEGTGEVTSTNQTVGGIKKENSAGLQRGRVHPKDQARTAALANRARQPNSPFTQKAKEKAQGNEPKPKEKEQDKKVVFENANDNQNPNSPHVESAKIEGTREKIPQVQYKEPNQHANDNEQER